MYPALSLRMPSLISLTLSDSKVGIVGDGASLPAVVKRRVKILNHTEFILCAFFHGLIPRATHTQYLMAKVS